MKTIDLLLCLLVALWVDFKLLSCLKKLKFAEEKE